MVLLLFIITLIINYQLIIILLQFHADFKKLVFIQRFFIIIVVIIVIIVIIILELLHKLHQTNHP